MEVCQAREGRLIEVLAVLGWLTGVPRSGDKDHRKQMTLLDGLGKVISVRLSETSKVHYLIDINYH